MHEFNLRPWRVIQRRQRTQQLLMTLCVVSALTLGLIAGLSACLERHIQQQKSANQRSAQNIQHAQTGLKQDQVLTATQQTHWAQIQQERDNVIKLLAKLNPQHSPERPSWAREIQLTQIQWQPPYLKLLGEYRTSASFKAWIAQLQAPPMPWVVQAQKRKHHHFSLELSRHD